MERKIKETNISQWRRTVCGDLTASFRPYNGEKIPTPVSLKRDEVVESIHKAKFKALPSNYKRLSADEIAQIKKNPSAVAFMASQEKGTRPACALTYELYVDGMLKADKKSFEISLKRVMKYLVNNHPALLLMFMHLAPIKAPLLKHGHTQQ